MVDKPTERRNWTGLRLLFVIVIATGVVAGCSAHKGSGPEAVNHAPTIEEIADTTAVVGDTLFLQVTGSDPDGDDLDFSLVIPCSWPEMQQGRCPIASIRSADLVFWFWPRTYDLSFRSFSIKVDDGRGGRDSTSFRVAVSSSGGSGGSYTSLRAGVQQW